MQAYQQARSSTAVRVDRPKQLQRWFGSDRTLSWLLLAPALIVIAAVFVYPLGYSLWMSLQSYNIITPARFIGLRNYQRILTDDTFWQSTVVTWSSPSRRSSSRSCSVSAWPCCSRCTPAAAA
jgi:ABC-type polysaccharide transport system permease subunit